MNDEPTRVERVTRPEGQVTARKIEDLDDAERRLIEQVRKKLQGRSGVRKGLRWWSHKRGR